MAISLKKFDHVINSIYAICPPALFKNNRSRLFYTMYLILYTFAIVIIKGYHIYEIKCSEKPFVLKVLLYNKEGSVCITNIILTLTVICKGKQIKSLLEDIENLRNHSWTSKNSTKYIRLCIALYFLTTFINVSITYWIYSKKYALIIAILIIYGHGFPTYRITASTISLCFIMYETKKAFVSLNSRMQSPHHFEEIINQKALSKAFKTINKINDIFGAFIAGSVFSNIFLILNLLVNLNSDIYNKDVVNVIIWFMLASFYGVSR